MNNKNINPPIQFKYKHLCLKDEHETLTQTILLPIEDRDYWDVIIREQRNPNLTWVFKILYTNEKMETLKEEYYNKEGELIRERKIRNSSGKRLY